MKQEATEVFITVNHLRDFGGYTRFMLGDGLAFENVNRNNDCKMKPEEK